MQLIGISPVSHGRTGNVKILTTVFPEAFYQGAGLSSARFDTYLADFPHLSATEAARCEGCITEDEVRETLKLVRLDKSSEIYGLPYEVYLRLSHMFVPLLATIYNNWMRQSSIPRRFTRGIVKLLRMNKHGGDEISKITLSQCLTSLKGEKSPFNDALT